VCDPLQSHSAADFVRATQVLIPAIQQRGRLPLLVGGTMLYFKALIDGLDTMPASDRQVRAEIEAQAARDGWPAMHALLAQVDPATAQRLPPHDAQRISRALEVWRISGRPLSAHFSPRLTAQMPGALRDALGRRALLLSLEPEDRSWLHQRIESRFDQMLDQGLLEEVLRLRALPGWNAQVPAMRCVGYRQAWSVLAQWASLGWTDERLLASLATPKGKPSSTAQAADPALKAGLNAWRSTSLAATRQLAKRQLTWLRGMSERQVVACDAPNACAQVLSRVRSGWRAG
jgi:tRNA dimethylallyltransferase